MEVNKLEGYTLDGVSENVSTLAQAFPEVIIDGKVDFEKLRLLLGEDIDDAEERYSFTWPGKRDAIKLAISRTTGTLRPDKTNSKDWDTTKNLFIEGDNLEVLRVLQNTYRGKVKMIYIDPPYNTGKDFVYKDDFKDNIANYKEQAGLEGQSNADTSGRYHTNWLNMMYPRLRLAKNLLKDDGVIFISIDDHEVHNLRKICDEIFGEENFVGDFIWHKKLTGGYDNVWINTQHEYILLYAKNKPNYVIGKQKKESSYTLTDEFGKKFKWDSLWTSSLTYSHSLDYQIIAPDGTPIDPFGEKGRAFWLWSKEKVERERNLLKFQKDKNENWKVYKRVYASEDGLVPSSVLEKSIVGGNTHSAMEMKDLLGERYFDYAKTTSLLKFLIETGNVSENQIVLDFFAGSATTGHAVMQLNAENSGTQRFIMVQIPETTPEDSEARKAGYKTISEISRERVRRAGEKVKQDYADSLKERTVPLDVGFKAFTLDTTNFREWDTDTENIEASLLAALDTFKEGRDSEDALYEVLLKYGVDLTEPVEVLTLAGKQVYSLAGNYLLVCLEKHISLQTIEEMAKLNPSRVVCYDDGFENDEVKQNALETLKRAGVEDVRVI
jgi:adenine-specific DNA-methyltransferase